MTLRIPAKVLLHVWSYDFYDMTLSTGKQRRHMIILFMLKHLPGTGKSAHVYTQNTHRNNFSSRANLFLRLKKGTNLSSYRSTFALLVSLFMCIFTILDTACRICVLENRRNFRDTIVNIIRQFC